MSPEQPAWPAAIADKSSGPLRASGTAGADSGVALNVRLADYSLNLPFAMRKF